MNSRNNSRRRAFRERRGAEQRGPYRLSRQREVDGDVVRSRRRPLLPGRDQIRQVDPSPVRLDTGGHRLRDGGEPQRRDHPELPTTRAAQRPEQVRLVVGVHDTAVGEHDLGPDQAVAGQPVLASEQPDPTAEGEPRDAHGRPAPRRQGPPVRVECGIDLAQPGSGADRRHAVVGDADPVEAGQVEHDPVRRRPAREAVPAAARDDPFLPHPRVFEGGDDVRNRAAPEHEPGPHVAEGQRLVAG